MVSSIPCGTLCDVTVIAIVIGTGRYQLLIDSKTRLVNNKPVKFINDAAITKDGRALYFTSSSSKYGRSDHHKIIIEGETTGRFEKIKLDDFCPFGGSKYERKF